MPLRQPDPRSKTMTIRRHGPDRDSCPALPVLRGTLGQHDDGRARVPRHLVDENGRCVHCHTSVGRAA